MSERDSAAETKACDSLPPIVFTEVPTGFSLPEEAEELWPAEEPHWPWVEMTLDDSKAEAVAARWQEEWTRDLPSGWRAAPTLWLVVMWLGLSGRERTVLARRASGETLDAIAGELDVTRERVRQIQAKATSRFTLGLHYFYPSLDDRLKDLDRPPTVNVHTIQRALGLAPSVALDVLLAAKGFHHPRAWAHPIDHWWARSPSRVQDALARTFDLAPFDFATADEIAADLELPDDFETVFDAEHSKLVRHELGWIRRARRARDVAYLWLQAGGEPQTADAIANVAGVKHHAIRETMHRDPDFVQLRPEGTWALAAWSVPSRSTRYASAVDAMVEVLAELGPLDYNQLRDEVQRRYPVSSARVQQCLLSSQVGRFEDARYGLVERGAMPLEEAEPHQPEHIRAVGDVIGVELPVSRDMLRGSGLAVHPWLTWFLGLRTAPSSRHFQIAS